MNKLSKILKKMNYKFIIPYSLQGFGLAFAFSGYLLIGSVLVITGFILRKNYLSKIKNP